MRLSCAFPLRETKVTRLVNFELCLFTIFFVMRWERESETILQLLLFFFIKSCCGMFLYVFYFCICLWKNSL